MLNNYYREYIKMLAPNGVPTFLLDYSNTKNMERLKKVGYFCGMDFASKSIYNFDGYISRYDHSLSCALLTYHLSHNKIHALAALHHDIATPCFSHVIDYMNGDYVNQESTEDKTKQIILEDEILTKKLKRDKIDQNDIINFKKWSIVDTQRPKLCADRVDGVILTSLFWTKYFDNVDVREVVNNLTLYENEEKQLEIGFKDIKAAIKFIHANELIDDYCHSIFDTYMMELLSYITKKTIENDIISYDDLFILNEEQLIDKILESHNYDIIQLLYKFQNIKKEDIPKSIELPRIKRRVISPIVNGNRIK